MRMVGPGGQARQASADSFSRFGGVFLMGWRGPGEKTNGVEGSRPYTNGVEGSSGLGGLPVPEGRPLVLHPELWSSDLSILYRESISLDQADGPFGATP